MDIDPTPAQTAAANTLRRAYLAHLDATKVSEKKQTSAVLEGMTDLLAEMSGRCANSSSYYIAVRDAVQHVGERPVVVQGYRSGREDLAQWNTMVNEHLAQDIALLDLGVDPFKVRRVALDLVGLSEPDLHRYTLDVVDDYNSDSPARKAVGAVFMAAVRLERERRLTTYRRSVAEEATEVMS